MRNDAQLLGNFPKVGFAGHPGQGVETPQVDGPRVIAQRFLAEHYFNKLGEKTLRNYSRPINLRRFDSLAWMTSETDLWEIPEYLCVVSHTPLLQDRKSTRLNS